MNRLKKRGKVIRSGGFEVRVNNSHTGCRIVYYKLGKRVFERCSSEQHAEERAREILAQYNSGVSLAILQSPHEMVKYERSLSMLGPLNVDIDQAVSDYAQARQILGSVPIIEAARFFRKFYTQREETNGVEEVVDEFLRSLMDGHSKVYIKDMRARLGQLARSLRCQINQLTPDKFELFFDQLQDKSPRTYNNYRRAIGTFLNYCKKKDYLPNEVDLLRKVEVRKERLK